MSSTVVYAKGLEPPFYTPIFKNGSRFRRNIALGPRDRRTKVVGGLATAAILPRPDLYVVKVYEPRPTLHAPPPAPPTYTHNPVGPNGYWQGI